jgi:hypothetical protein
MSGGQEGHGWGVGTRRHQAQAEAKYREWFGRQRAGCEQKHAAFRELRWEVRQRLERAQGRL